MAQGLDVVINGVETVSEKMDDIENSVRAANQALGSLSSELREASVSSEILEQSSESVANAATKVNGTVRGAAGAVDSLGDESREAAAEVGFLGTVMDKTSVSAGALSINVGAFTVALRQLHTQIPLIVTTLGSLISVLGGVGAAAIAAGGGISALLAGGAIGLLEDIESQFADVTSTGEALMKLMRGLGNMFRQALDPLVNAENVELFVSLLEDMANFANMSAQAIDASRESIMRFFSVVGQSADFNRFAGSLQNVMEFEAGGEFDSAGEVLARFLKYLVGELPDAIDFFNRVTVNLAAPLQEVAYQFKLLTIELVEFAEGAAPGFVEVITTILSVFTELFDEINNLNGSLTSAAVKTFAFTAIVLRLAKAFDSVALIAIKFSDLINTLTTDLGNFSKTVSRIITAGQGFLDEYAKGVLKLSRNIVAQIPILNQLQVATKDIYDDGNLKDFDIRLTSVKENVDNAISSVKNFGSKISSIGEGSSLRKQIESDDLFFDIEGRPQTPEGFASQPDIFKAGPIEKTIQRIRGGISNMVSSARKNLGKLRETGVMNALRQGMSRAGKAALSTGKQIASGFGNVALGGLETFTAGMVSMLHPGLIKSKGLTQVFNDGISRMSKGLNQLGLGVIPRVVGAIATKIGALYSSVAAFVAAEIAAIKLAFAQGGLITGLKQTAKSAVAASVGFVTYIAGALAGAAASLTFNAALGGLPLLIGAVVAGAALLVGAIGNADGIASSAKSSFAGLKEFALALGEALLGLLVPAFNLIVDIVMAILSPIFAIVDGFMLIADSISSAASQGEEGAGIMESFGSVMDVLGGVLSSIAPIFRVIGDIIYAVFITPFKIAASVIGFFIGKIVQLIKVIKTLAKESGLIDALTSVVETIEKRITGIIDAVVSVINKVIKQANKIPGVNVGMVGEDAGGASLKGDGLKITESDVKDNLAKDSKDASGERADTTSPNFNLETNVQNTANVDAESDESEDRIATLVERAMKDANTYRRNSLGTQ